MHHLPLRSTALFILIAATALACGDDEPTSPSTSAGGATGTGGNTNATGGTSNTGGQSSAGGSDTIPLPTTTNCPTDLGTSLGCLDYDGTLFDLTDGNVTSTPNVAGPPLTTVQLNDEMPTLERGGFTLSFDASASPNQTFSCADNEPIDFLVPGPDPVFNADGTMAPGSACLIEIAEPGLNDGDFAAGTFFAVGINRNNGEPGAFSGRFRIQR